MKTLTRAQPVEIGDWVEESRAHRKPFGPPPVGGRQRVDLEAGHCAGKPALRLVDCAKKAKTASLFTMTGRESKQAAG
jgi:hypothetical protein